MKSISSKSASYIGFLGFLGFLYFKQFDPSYLWFFGFFSYFGYFFVYKIFDDKEDERMKENKNKALILSLRVFVLLLFIACYSGAMRTESPSKEFYSIILAIGIFLQTFVYILTFYLYERKL